MFIQPSLAFRAVSRLSIVWRSVVLMRDLYDAIGSIVAAGHANGHTVRQTYRPEDGPTDSHTLKFEANSYVVRFQAQKDEPRFSVSTLFPFDSVLRNSYTPAEISDRAGVDAETLPEEKREQVVQSLVETDLEQIQQSRDDFKKRCSDELSHQAHNVRTVSLSDGDLWNGFLVRDYVFPYDGFSPSEYRDAVGRIEQITRRTREIAYDVTNVFGESRDRGESDNPLNKQTRSSPGFH